jgi:DNA-directed RNA polymerase subunit RPC12/RpoP
MDPRDHLDSWSSELGIALMNSKSNELMQASTCLICFAPLNEAVPTEENLRIECPYCSTTYDLSFPKGTLASLELRSPYTDKELLNRVRVLWNESSKKEEFQKSLVELLRSVEKSG